MQLLIVFTSFVLFKALASSHESEYDVEPFTVDLEDDVPRMLDLARDYRLPAEPEYPGVGDAAGIDLDVLKDLRRQWVEEYDWHEDQAYMNTFQHYTAEIEGLRTHFIHERSADPDAIPLLLEHGWPGSFLEFAPVIKELTQPTTTSNGKKVSFHVIVPSLPGFVFSQAPPANWTADDTARLHHTLMTEVLGYEFFAVHGTDWGSALAYSLYDRFNHSTRALHAVFLPFYPLTSAQLATENISLTPLEAFEAERFDEWNTNGNGYFYVQATKPNTIGLALQDSPIGQLAWIGEKFIEWSDPRASSGPSVVTHHEILRSVSLYYLTRSFLSSVYMYYQNPNGPHGPGFRSDYTKARTDAPLLFSAFKYNLGFWPPALVARVGNLVEYRNHEFGGHFPGLDNPPQLLEDLREIGTYWEASLSGN